MIMEKGKYVSRSVYQKAKEENKRLLADIKVMACGECFDAIQLRIKWRKIFEKKEQFEKTIREILRANSN